jgi:hypothetical protein
MSDRYVLRRTASPREGIQRMSKDRAGTILRSDVREKEYVEIDDLSDPWLESWFSLSTVHCSVDILDVVIFLSSCTCKPFFSGENMIHVAKKASYANNRYASQIGEFACS